MHWNPYGTRVQVELLYVPDCPNAARARERLERALAEVGATQPLRDTAVEDEHGAARAGMHGSPTILIDGTDPFAGDDTSPSLSCRLTQGDDGVVGVPTVDELVRALRRRMSVEPAPRPRHTTAGDPSSPPPGTAPAT